MEIKSRKNQVNYEKLAKKGESIYKKIKNHYEPTDNGKLLAIEIESGDVFLANEATEAVRMAKKAYPHKMFYLVRIGFDSVDAIANASRPTFQ